ncbi:MAG: dihydrolipoyllysine-residue succinyltransferase [Candidatus Neptunochlamydia sp.]|nr:dihydrolipoyllysine-residue succinyltransferase [Candidatus Neptunochlamydia sp.]
MKVEITVPPVGESVTEATVAVIMVASGTFVNKDDQVLELETDKVNQVLYAADSGTLNLTIAVDDIVKPNQVIGFIDTEGKGEVKATAAPEPKKNEAPPPPPPSTDEGVRRSVDDYVVSIGKEKTTPSPPSTPAPEVKVQAPKKVAQVGQTRKRMSGLRRTVAKRLVEAKNTTAMLTTFNAVDMSAVMDIRAREKDAFMKKHDVKLGFMSFFVKACCAALKELPDVNAFIDGDEIVYNDGMHISISVSTPKGLMVPVLRNAETLSFAGVERGIQTFAQKAREGKIAIEDLQGGTFTITNGGVFGSMLSTPILNPPQSAILGMHNIVKRPVVIDDKIEICPMMYLALSYDHRTIDGKEAVTFLVRVKELLEKPERLLLGETDD